MSLFQKIFGGKKPTASTARDRLMVTLAHERAQNSFPFMEELRKDLLEVVKKYVEVEDVKITTEQNQNIDMLEIDISLKKR